MTSSALRRLCVVTPVHWSAVMGGAQYQIKCLLDALIPMGRYEIFYLTRRVAADLVPEGYRVAVLNGDQKVPQLGYLMDAWPLYQALRRIRPDVIYQRIGCGYTGIAAHYARRHGARLIWHVSSDTDVIPQRLRGGSNSVRRFLEKRSIEYGIRHAHHIVAQTEAQVRLLERHYGRAADVVIRNFHPEPLETIDKTGPVTVVWVANLKPLKQPEVFVRLASQLRELADVRFTMVGAPPGARRRGGRWYQELVQSLDATPNVAHVGRKAHPEVNELLATAHVLVNTSLHEGFPNTYIQAWMREVPVVSLHIDPDGVLRREGIGIHAQTEERLVEAVRMLVTDPAERAAYGARARQYAMLRHSMRNARFIEQLIATGRVEHTGEDLVSHSGR